MKNNLIAAAAALTLNTTVTAADLSTPAIQLPPCFFAGGRCWQCDHYSGGYCYYHKSSVDPEKYSCSYFR